MWLFTCAEARKPPKQSTFVVHHPPSSEWTYGAWVGPKDKIAQSRPPTLADRDRDRARQPSKLKPGHKTNCPSHAHHHHDHSHRFPSANNTRCPTPKPNTRTHTHHNQHSTQRQTPSSRRRPPIESTKTQWATLAEIEANERYGPRGRNERYERSGGSPDSVEQRYEPAYAKLIVRSERKGRSRRMPGGEDRGGREERDPWGAGAGVTVPKVSKFREEL